MIQANKGTVLTAFHKRTLAIRKMEVRASALINYAVFSLDFEPYVNLELKGNVVWGSKRVVGCYHQGAVFLQRLGPRVELFDALCGLRYDSDDGSNA